MKILITGAGGFIGSHLTEMCLEQGYEVKVFLRYNSRNFWGWLDKSGIENDVEIVTGDIRDYDSVSKAIKKCDSVIHLAALIGIPYSYTSPLAYIQTNVIGTYNILESSKIEGLSNVLITSTSETYGTANYVPIDEKHPVNAQSPYAASKIAADHMALSYYNSFELPVKIVKPFNNFGPRQSARAIIPTIITQILANEKGSFGNIRPTRDFIYVKDSVAAFLEILKSDNLFGEVVNVGTNNEISIENLINEITGLLNKDFDYKVDEERIRPEKSEVNRLKCDNTKILESTNWQPEYSLAEGLCRTIDWIKDNMKYYKPNLYNV